MGILSLVGLKMYHNAVNSHRANELIYEANKRATMVAAQLMAGRSSDQLSVAEFTDPAGYHFGVAGENNRQFKITLNVVDEDICTQMKNIVGQTTAIRKIEDNCTEMIYNNDLSVTTEAQCTGSGKIWCAATGLCSETGACCGGKDCSATSCPTGSSTTGAGGSTGVFAGGVECKCAEGYVYTGTACTAQPSVCHDWTKNECGFGYYCNFTYNVNDNMNPDLNGVRSPTEEQCYHDLSGTCAKIVGYANISDADRALLRKVGFKSTFTKGNAAGNFWKSYSWCLGQGKRLIEISDLECYNNGQKLVKKGSGYAYCCKQGQLCQQSSWETGETALWNGQEILSEKEDEVAKFSDKFVALRQIFGGAVFWSATPYRGNGSMNSCDGFYVGTSIGYAGYNGRSSNYFPICQ